MKQAGQIALLPFPFTDLSGRKLRPVLLLRRASHRFDDWLVCMVSSQLSQAEAELDEIIRVGDAGFSATGLKVDSVIRLSRLAVVSGEVLIGSLGHIEAHRLRALKARLGRWMAQDEEG